MTKNLHKLRGKLELLGQFGRTSTVDRALDLVATAGDAPEKLIPLPTDFGTVAKQRRAEHMGVRIFGSIEDELTFHFIELMTGLKDSVEVVSVDDETYDRAWQRAREHVRKEEPSLIINMHQFSSTDEVLAALRLAILEVEGNREAVEAEIGNRLDTDHHDSELLPVLRTPS